MDKKILKYLSIFFSLIYLLQCNRLSYGNPGYYTFVKSIIYQLPKDSTNCTVNCPPIARPDRDSVVGNSPLLVNVPKIGLNDTYYGPVKFSAVVKVKTLMGGEMTMETSGRYSYLPPMDFTGMDSFIYTVCNTKENTGCDTSILYIKVLPAPLKAPIAIKDSFEIIQSQVFKGSVINNDVYTGAVIVKLLAGMSRSTANIILETTGSFTYESNADFSGLDTFYYSLCNLSGSCGIGTVIINAEMMYLPEVIISKNYGFSPNKDGINDFFEIKNIEYFKNNTVKIFNRWGNLVYEVKGYDNNVIKWDGTALKSGNSVPEGTYYYVVSIGENVEDLTGYLMVVR